MSHEGLLDKMILWEQGDLDEVDTIALFQQLIDSGTVWKLQGTYGRTACALIARGYCHPVVKVRPAVPSGKR